jgi:predicted transposase YbfD/YdcC
MEAFGLAKEDWLRRFLRLPHGIPSHDTFRAVISRIDPSCFSECFTRWTAAIHELTGGEVIALDGKTIRHSFDTATGQSALHIVSAWATTSGVALGQIRVDEKSNEIKAIPKLLELLEIRGCIVTVDAMGCQTDIAEKIIDRGGDYVLCLKGNQTGLHEDVNWFFEEITRSGFGDLEHRYFESVEKDHGRIEIRRCWMVEDDAIAWLGEQGHKWSGLRSLAAIQAERHVGGKVSTETRYFISSLTGSAEQLALAARSHWGIENSLHWVLDMTMNEDRNRIRKDNAPENLSILRKIAINSIKREISSPKASVRVRFKKAAWDNSYLEKVLVS